MEIDWNVVTAIWLPIVWPLVAALVVYLVNFRSIDQPERYWTMSIAFGSVSVVLTYLVAALASSIIPAGFNGVHESLGPISTFFHYALPICVCILVARRSG